MRTAALLLVIGLLLMGAVAAFAPATLVDRRLAALTDGNLRIAEAQGTVWAGRGTLTDARGSWQLPLAWQLSAAAITRGMVEASIAPVAGTTPAGMVRVDGSDVSLSQFAVEVPAIALAAALPARDAVALGGVIVVSTPAFAFDGTRGTGSLDATWRNARGHVAGRTLDLGTIDVTLAPQDVRLAGRVVNRGGDVKLDAAIALAAKVLTVDGTLAPNTGAGPDVASMLSALGPVDAAGRVRITYRGRLR